MLTGPFSRPIAAVVVAALVGAPCHAAAHEGEHADRGSESHSTAVLVALDQPIEIEVPLPPGTIRGSALHWASIESRRLTQSSQSGTAAASDRCSASVAEKLAWLYALVGGSLLLVYGPQEKEGGVWTMDGKSETVAGAVAIGLSFALLRDIRKKSR